MARHLTWCLKRTFVLTIQQTRFHTHPQTRFVAKTSDSIVHKPHLTAAVVTKPGFNVEEERDYRDLEMFMEDARKGRRHAITALMKLLSISEASAIKTVEDYPAFRNLQKQTIYENFQILRENGMFKSTIKDHQYLLIGTPEEVKSKIHHVEKFGVNINDGAPLFHLSALVLKVCSLYTKIDATYLPARNKLYYLAEKFNCDVKRICYAVSYSPYILTMPPPQLMTIAEYVLAAGMAPEHILADLILFKYPLSTVRQKIEQAKALGLHPLRPWMVRCSHHNWEAPIEPPRFDATLSDSYGFRARKRFEQRDTSLRPNITREELICEIFECDADLARCIIKKGRKIATMSFTKFHNNMKLLKSQGYSAEEVMMSTLTVQRKTHTLEKLFEMWNEAGLPKGRLCLFCKPTEWLQQVIAARRAEIEAGNRS